MLKKKLRLLVTGGAGFIGSEFVRQNTNSYDIAVIDKLTYAGDLARIKRVLKDIRFYKTDICNIPALDKILHKERPHIIVHFAAETHVDRSILDPYPFFETNIKGTLNLINAARKHRVGKFIHISTDEVYGEIRKGNFTELSPIHPNNPYSVSKAAADLLVQSAVRTYLLPAIIIRATNNYGPWQYPEKFIPVIILKALHNQKIPIYGRGRNVREWLHVSDCCRAIQIIMKKGKVGEIYNIGSLAERMNIDTAKCILKLLRKPASLIEFVQDRPGHDLRYSLDWRKTKKLGFQPEVGFEEGLAATLLWATENFPWLQGKKKYLTKYWASVYKKASS
jgi:dTDP-glucose 4,6-dehydratase